MKKILIANRGEIALRIIRSIKEMGIQTVAIYSEADRESPHVVHADESICIGPPPSSESYLKMDAIIEEALKLNVDGIHPGYGFLSENAVFAKKVAESGMTFIGPSLKAIEIMGNKLAAKEAVLSYDVPLVPGVDHAIEDITEAKKTAVEIGYPILIKASAGGGGKGMRIVEEERDFEDQMNRAMSEAKSAFGDGSVFIEKYVTSPRHIEIQVMADTHDNIVYLFERECSIQRRHQKVIEEAPSVIVSPEMRKAMGETACNVARSCGYVGAGTVEFLVDDQLNYYFLEMNTRLQVEHPVTELITGVDLVKEQVLVARGEKLSFTQDELTIDGHAIELRVYAEDPENNFLPDIGTLEVYKKPEGPGVRVDDGFREGMQIPIYYDPMISKLVVKGKDRTEALQRMKRAIEEYVITGIKTTLGFGTFVCNHPNFISGDFDTNFVQLHYKAGALKPEKDDTEIAGMMASFLFTNEQKTASNGIANGADQTRNKWKENRLK